jgi:hypothetical protein
MAIAVTKVLILGLVRVLLFGSCLGEVEWSHSRRGALVSGTRVEPMRHKGLTVLAVTGIDFSQNEVFPHKVSPRCQTLKLGEECSSIKDQPHLKLKPTESSISSWQSQTLRE